MRDMLNHVTDIEYEIIDRFGWNLVTIETKGRGSGKETYLTHSLLHGDAKMAIPIDLEHSTLTQAVATAAYTFNVNNWIRNADLSKYAPDPFISVEQQVKGDADYAKSQLQTLRSALGIK